MSSKRKVIEFQLLVLTKGPFVQIVKANYVRPTFLQNPNNKQRNEDGIKISFPVYTSGDEVPFYINFIYNFLFFNPKKGKAKNLQSCHSKCQIILKAGISLKFSAIHCLVPMHSG